MSASPSDTQPVFDMIARHCNAATAIAIIDGAMLHLAAQSGFDPANVEAYMEQFPRPVGLDSTMSRALLNRRVTQVKNLTTDLGHSFGPVFGHWTVVAIPIARDEIPLGAISLGRPGLGAALGQSDRELQARTEALAQRNSEHGERIEHQSAIIDVLKALSASPRDPQPVFDLIVHPSGRLAMRPRRCFQGQRGRSDEPSVAGA